MPKLVTLLVAGVLALNCLALPAPLAFTPSSQNPCHGHGGKVPSPDDNKYRCCLTGHDVAMPQMQVSLSRAMATSFALVPRTSLPKGLFFSVVPVLFEYPLGTRPLRI